MSSYRNGKNGFQREFSYSKAEYEAKLPLNWGKLIHDRLQERERERVADASSSKGTYKTVFSHSLKGSAVANVHAHLLKAIELYGANAAGPVDGGKVAQMLSVEEQCQFFDRYGKCRVLLLKDWLSLSDTVLRCVSITMGESLRDIDLSNSLVSSAHFEVLFCSMRHVHTVRLNSCQMLDGAAMGLLAKLCCKTLTELHCGSNSTFKVDPLLQLAGCIGVNAPKLSKLTLLNLGSCPLQDPGIIGVSTCCRLLRYLNMHNCSDLTDKSVTEIVAANKRLELLNLQACSKLTNRTPLAVGACCPLMQSLNISKCLLIDDRGVGAVAGGCAKLQALNLSGLLKVTEEVLCVLAQRCPNILMLNVTGCELVTTDGVKNLISGLKGVCFAVSFFGFRPVDEHVSVKMEDHCNHLNVEALKFFEAGMKERARKAGERERNLRLLHERSADTIKSYMKRYCLRVYFYYKWRKKHVQHSATAIQRLHRGRHGRRRAEVRQQEVIRFLSLGPQATHIQRVTRAHLCRLRCRVILKAQRDMYTLRQAEAEASISVRFQAKARRYLAIERVKALREVARRRRCDEQSAILLIQMLVRRSMAILKVKRMRYAKKRLDELHYKMATKIARFYRKKMNEYISKLSGKDLMKVMRKSWSAGMLLQRVFRGYSARERIHRLRIKQAVEYAAAVFIQKSYRGARIMSWKDMRLNIIAAFVLDRQYLERRERVAMARLRYAAYVEENRRDSASEEDVREDEIEWKKMYDKDRKKHYWVNEVENTVTFDEPHAPLFMEKAMLNKRVKVYWVAQDVWYDGWVSDYHKMKRRHRIEYDDGDHEWLNFARDYERVQVMLDDGSYVMYTIYQPPEVLREWNKIDERKRAEDFKAQANRDAIQWEVVADDHVTGVTMFISNITGELRTGTDEALDWVVQDDGYGFPSFSNVKTGATQHEDPRFIYDNDENLSEQRKYCLAEMRYALYFCRDYWQKYDDAIRLGDRRQVNLLKSQIRTSSKPKHLASFLIRCKALYRATSVVDKNIYADILQELDFATWISMRMAEVADQANRELLARRENKVAVISKLTRKSGLPIFCAKCGKQSEKHLDFCPHCGVQQGVTYMYHLTPREKKKVKFSEAAEE